MKKFIVLIIMFLVFLSGCSKESTSEKNQKILEQFDEVYSNYNASIDDVNKVKMELDLLTKIESENYNSEADSFIDMNICSKPFYIEVYNEGNEKIIITENNGKLYTNEFIDESLIERKYLMDHVQLLEKYNQDTSIDLITNTNNLEATFSNNKFKFVQKYSDLISNEEKEYLNGLYSQLGIDSDSFENLTIETTFEFNESKLTCCMKLEMPYKIESIECNIIVDVAMEIYESDFEFIDLSKCEYLAAEKVEDVYDYSSLGEKLIFRGNTSSFFKFRLEEGVYAFKNEYYIASYPFKFELLDENLERLEVDYILDPTIEKNTQLSRTFIISKPGTYYIKTFEQSDVYSLEKIDYNAKFKEIHAGINETIKCSISSQDSYGVIRFNLEEDAVVSLTSLTSEKVNFYALTNGYYQRLVSYSTLPGFFVGHKGENVIYITHDLYQFSNIECYNHEFVLNVHNGSGYEENVEELDYISTTPSEKLYVAGYGIEGGRLRLSLDKPQYIIFCEQHITGTSQFFNYNVEVYDTGKVHYLYGNNQYILEAGNYIISLSQDEWDLTLGYVYYKCEDINYDADFEVEIEKTKLDYYDINFPKVVTFDRFKEETIRYWFTLTEEACIHGELYKLNFFDSSNNQINHYDDYIYLQPGSYYFELDNKYNLDSSGGTKVKLAILDYEHISQEIDLVIGNSTYYISDYLIEIPKTDEIVFYKYYFTLNEDSIVYFSGCSLYDENGNMYYSNLENTIDLKAGRYYVRYYLDYDKFYLGIIVK